MHEMGLAQNIIDTVFNDIAPDRNQVAGINVEVGVLSGVIGESLEFCLKALLESQDLSGIKVNVNRIPTLAKCECGIEYQLDNVFELCPNCSSFSREILSGKDLVLKSVELRD